ncbi:hypothetical protein Ddc_09723 [Ditylenchus destructor]|nr:hypothetical protein Ddc_09723 [Ditylenchus destructor]
MVNIEKTEKIQNVRDDPEMISPYGDISWIKGLQRKYPEKERRRSKSRSPKRYKHQEKERRRSKSRSPKRHKHREKERRRSKSRSPKRHKHSRR